jgi:hypothetical protein
MPSGNIITMKNLFAIPKISKSGKVRAVIYLDVKAKEVLETKAKTLGLSFTKYAEQVLKKDAGIV